MTVGRRSAKDRGHYLLRPLIFFPTVNVLDSACKKLLTPTRARPFHAPVFAIDSFTALNPGAPELRRQKTLAIIARYDQGPPLL